MTNLVPSFLSRYMKRVRLSINPITNTPAYFVATEYGLGQGSLLFENITAMGLLYLDIQEKTWRASLAMKRPIGNPNRVAFGRYARLYHALRDLTIRGLDDSQPPDDDEDLLYLQREISPFFMKPSDLGAITLYQAGDFATMPVIVRFFVNNLINSLLLSISDVGGPTLTSRRELRRLMGFFATISFISLSSRLNRSEGLVKQIAFSRFFSEIFSNMNILVNIF